jgi:hypothetical protein
MTVHWSDHTNLAGTEEDNPHVSAKGPVASGLYNNWIVPIRNFYIRCVFIVHSTL